VDDRLRGPDYSDVANTNADVPIRFTEAIDTTTSMGSFIFHITAARRIGAIDHPGALQHDGDKVVFSGDATRHFSVCKTLITH
jgi:hypothetical protein